MNAISKRGCLLLLALIAVFAPAQPTVGAARPQSSQGPAAAVTLSLSSPSVRPGESLTLAADYTRLGMVHTWFTITSAESVRFTPPLPERCFYDEHPYGCELFPLQALITGTVTFEAHANGETFDDECQCWYFITVTSPKVTLVISGTPNFPPRRRIHLPLVAQPAGGQRPASPEIRGLRGGDFSLTGSGAGATVVSWERPPFIKRRRAG